MLQIHVPNTYIPERKYIIYILMQDFLGIDIQLFIGERSDVLIKDNDMAGEKGLHIADVFFQTPPSQWLVQDSLPKQPLTVWDTAAVQNVISDFSLVTTKLPVIYGSTVETAGLTKNYFSENKNGLHLGLDVFGAAFFMLTRYEELVKPDRDVHDRFPAGASLACQEDFLDRPIINEYLEVLWRCLKRLWPGLKRKKRKFRMFLSHDVDEPFAQAFAGISKLVRNCGGDVLRRKSPLMALQRIRSWQKVKKGDFHQDFNYTFDHFMDISEQNGLQSAFYFKAACTNLQYDDTYSIGHPYLRQLLQDIHRRGHEIGLHPSYETYQNPEQTAVEFHRLLQVCEEGGIQQDGWGGRQHYLRWQVPTTWHNWARAGLSYDSTLSYADHAGFRCGLCYEFPVYDLEQRKPLHLIERPLVVMEGSVLDAQYMNLTGETALNVMLELKDRCRLFNGDFTLLWHNSSFDTLQMREMYRSVVEG